MAGILSPENWPYKTFPRSCSWMCKSNRGAAPVGMRATWEELREATCPCIRGEGWEESEKWAEIQRAQRTSYS